jgi:hypothetical protein
MENLKFHPQVSTNGNTIKYLMEVAKIIKMGSLHASQKWSFSKKLFFWIELSKFMIIGTT